MRGSIEGRVAGVRLGLSVFLRAGMVGWMDAWSGVAAQSARSEPSAGGERQPGCATSEVVAVLAAMAMGALEERRT
ncbi:MAG: hypothetical protein ACRDH5_12645 [bacterium]